MEDDPAWEILRNWHAKYGDRIKPIANLFLRADGGGLHYLAREINAAIAAAAKKTETE